MAKTHSLVVTVGALLALASTTPVVAGQFFTCNGCNLNSMRTAAAAYGAGEHLVINVSGQTGIIVMVSCGGPLDQPEDDNGRKGSRDPKLLFNGCSTDVRWSPDDQLALDYLLDGMQLDGSWAKDVTVTRSESIYDVAVNPGLSLPGIADSIASNALTYSPAGTSWGALVSWAQAWSNISSNGEIRVIIQFPDGSMDARIGMSWIGQTTAPRPGDITIIVTSARDANGNPVPNLTNPDGNLNNGTFAFFGMDIPPPEWTTLVETLGYTVTFNSGFNTSVWTCVDVRDSEGNIVSRECNEV